MPPKTKKDSIYEQYFSITNEYIEKYGKNTILFYQVGAFFEMYGVQNKRGDVLKSRVDEFTQLAQLNMSSKEIEVEEGTVIMAGFRDYSLDKYLKIATNNGFTAVVYIQNMSNPKNITRELLNIYSPGTYISYDTESSQQLSNNIICVWITTYKPFHTNTRQLVCGISSSHIFTGESSILEYETPFIMNPTTFDELERYISIISPSEAIIISSLSEKDTNTVIQYSGLKTNTIHKIILETEKNRNKIEIIENCQKEKYISHMLSTFFGEEAFQICSEFKTHLIATQSFCYLLNFLQEHNPDLVRKITIPVFNNSGNHMILANHTLKQLNIIDDETMDGKKSGKFSSVLSFLNKCCNPMGRRAFQTQLTNPIFDEERLNNEYNILELFLHFSKNKSHIYDSYKDVNTKTSISTSELNDSNDILGDIRKQLHKIRDLEKICRQIVTSKIYPNSIFLLYESIQYIQQLNLVFLDNEKITNYLCSQNNNIESISKEILEFMNSVLIINNCKGIETISNINENIIQKGICENLDQVINEYNKNIELFNCIYKTFNAMMKSNNDETEYIKIHETEKSGSTLQITKKRGELLRQVLKSTKETIVFSPELTIQTKDIRFIKASSSAEEIEFPQLTTILKKIMGLKEKMTDEISKMFLQFVRTLEEKWYEKIEILIKWVIKLDVLQCKTYIARTYNYCKPIIDSSQKQSFVDIKGLRHVLIEHIQQNEIYVTNDLLLSSSSTASSSYNGLLIFGTNAVGKTSFIRAVGISIIMAQAGLFVPCSSFRYKPYTSIFSRILGNDNIFKGLSTFAVEMSELRIILKMANENSLVLGDELCSGTEIESALSLFSAGLIELHEKKSTFLFATHFHEITKYEEIQQLNKLGLKHMSVHYDKATNNLIYDRILKDGQGSRMYGLEVCKSLYMDDAFLDLAYSFRNKYFPEQKGELQHSSSQYNKKKIRGICQICKIEIAEETHHLSPQKDANEQGYIGSFHKNHKANLASVCESCHNNLHETNTSIKIKKSIKGYIFDKTGV
jgi:DNA mismatch repair protein MutS